MQQAIVEGKIVKIGDTVGFKCDIEQSGTITKIRRIFHLVELTLENPHGFSGDYIGGRTITTALATECWID